MKILITGGTTFVSKYTAEYFSALGNHVAVMNRGSRKQVEGVDFICCDRCECRKYLSGSHFDAILDITAYTAEHVKDLLDSGVTFDDYILISSSAVYPETNPQPFTEDQPCGRNTIWGDYGTNKLAAETVLLEKVPSAYILRPPYFYGKYENVYREAFPFDCADNDRPFYIPSDGSMRMQFLNVADLCRFIDIILKEHPAKHIFNVGNKETISIADWVRICYKAAGKQPELISVDSKFNQRDYFCFHNYEYYLDVTDFISYIPDTIPLEDGISEEYIWYKQNPDSIYFKKPYLEFIKNNLS